MFLSSLNSININPFMVDGTSVYDYRFIAIVSLVELFAGSD